MKPADSTTVIEARHSTRAKRLSLTVYPEGRAILTIPPRTSQGMINRFLEDHRDWLKKQLDSAKDYSNCIFLPAGQRDYKRNKERARCFIKSCLEHHNKTYGLNYCRVAVKNLYASWGSCSSKKNLNFNYKLIHLPKHLAEYIIVHELCHLAEMNHSTRFWSLVAKTIPNHRKIRKELHRYQL